jgi:hypothetical protein
MPSARERGHSAPSPSAQPGSTHASASSRLPPNAPHARLVGWLAVPTLIDSFRLLFKTNVHALRLVLLQLDYWIPAVSLVAGLACAAHAFEWDIGAVVYFTTVALQLHNFVLLGGCNAREAVG